MSHDEVKQYLREARTCDRFAAQIGVVLQLLENKDATISISQGRGQSSRDIARIYKVRMANPKFDPNAFDGFSESIQSLESEDTVVTLLRIRTETTIVAIWRTAGRRCPAAVLVGRSLDPGI